jgi:hypothetical protein
MSEDHGAPCFTQPELEFIEGFRKPPAMLGDSPLRLKQVRVGTWTRRASR